MANVYAVKNGNWSDTTLWNTGSLPTTVDDVYANTFTVYVDISPQVLSVRNLSATSITRGGSFILNNGISLSANVIGGGVDNVFCVRFLSAAPAFASITGNVSTSGSLVNVRQAFALELSSTGTLTVYGSAIGGNNNGSGTGVSDGYIQVNAPGTLNIFGSVQGSLNGNGYWGISNTTTGIVNIVGNVAGRTVSFGGVTNYVVNNRSTGTINITGNVVGGIDNSNFGVHNASAGTVNLLGNTIGGTGNNLNCNGIQNASTGLINVVGNAIGGTNTAAHGIRNESTGVVNITGSVQGGNGPSFANCNGVLNVLGTTNILGNILFSPNAGNNSVDNGSTGTINITGSVLLQPLTAAANSFAIAVYNTTTGSVNIYGDVSGGGYTNSYGVFNNSSGNITIYGNVSAGYGLTVSPGTAGLYNNSTGTARVIGNINASQSTGGTGAINNSTGTIAVTGNVYAFDILKSNFAAGQGGSGSNGISNNAGGIITVTGNIFGGSRSDAWGIVNNAAGIVTIFGNAYGGYLTDTDAIRIPTGSNGTVTLSGTAYGGLGATAYGLRNLTTGTGVARIKRAAGNSWGLGYTTALGASPGVFGSQTGSTFVEELECGPRGQWPTAGNIYFTPNTKATSMFETDTFQNYSLIQSNSADNLLPPVSSVRQGTTYNLGLSTGTCIIPPTSSVALNTLVDSLTGTAALTPQTTWNYPTTASDVDSMGGRLRNALNINSANSLINSFNP